MTVYTIDTGRAAYQTHDWRRAELASERGATVSAREVICP